MKIRFIVTSIFLYACELWTLTAELQRRIQAMEMKCYRKILHISYTTRKPPDDRKKTQAAVVWSCFLFIRSGQNHFARHSERGKKTWQTEEEVGRQHEKMDRPGALQVPEGSREQGQMKQTGCKIICCAPMTLAVKGSMMMMMMIKLQHHTADPVPICDHPF